MVKTEPDNNHAAVLKRQNHASLMKDKWFWTAMIIGPVSCWLMTLLLARSGDWTITWAHWRLSLWLVLLYPVAEEWVFRGMVQPWLLRKRYGRIACCSVSMANVIATLLFASAHLFTHTPAWATMVIVPSLIYGGFRDRYNSLFPGTLLHCSYNLSYFSFFGLPSG